MAWGHYEQNYVYNYDINAVLDAVMRAAEQVKLKLKKADRAAYKVKFSTVQECRSLHGARRFLLLWESFLTERPE
ncbi:hypothetical protein [Ruminococcus sp.]|uniref:hypothetical protein n=1 Tax=Ruminococcus sp. TaxID=41978 RepID=UPI0025E82419|nr:hypothetical protein [Ruminococcus sp.]MBQ6252232.1 hypothetical protein [Ruminococcus sp.]